MENQTQRGARVKASTVATIGLTGFIVGFLLGCLTYKRFNPCVELPVIAVQADTVIVRDTLRLEVPAPNHQGVKRRDTVWLEIKTQDTTKNTNGTKTPTDTNEADTVPRLEPNGAITIPIEEKEYKTEEYTAVIEGWRPRLLSMEVYPKTTTITNTVTRLQRPRWGVSVGVGGGYDGQQVRPHLGVTVGWLVWSGK